MSASRARAGLLAASLGLWLLVPFGWLLAHLPSAVGLAAGRRLGDLLWWVLPRRRAVALDNLRRAFGGECTPAGIRRLGRRSFQHVGMNLVEACRYFLRPTHVMLSRVRIEGREHVQAAASKGRGVLILPATSATGSAGRPHEFSGLPLSIVTRPLEHRSSMACRSLPATQRGRAHRQAAGGAGGPDRAEAAAHGGHPPRPERHAGRRGVRAVLRLPASTSKGSRCWPCGRVPGGAIFFAGSRTAGTAWT